MLKRRDVFVYVARPGREAEAKERLTGWLKELDGKPGYVGGSLARDAADELVKGAIILTLEFESTPAARALWPTLKDHPVESDILPKYPPDQSWALAEDAGHAHADGASHDHGAAEGEHDLPVEQRLEYNRGGGLFARIFHAHAEVEFEHRAATPARL